MTSTALDDSLDEDPAPKKPPAYCPWCGEGVEKRWVPNRVTDLRQRIGATVVYVCLACKVAVRAFKFPSRPLFKTKKAAHADMQREYDELEASGFPTTYVRDLYRRGKCSCSRHAISMMRPCAVHRPLERNNA